ncbi:MAG: nucleotidyltransferase family protein [Sorangiineae bacterium]|nr:nucleotidyltransferase family protein [Polyangiaceae bacterium]MEB2324447.1 nucleotidyltransferase family protein [Sorangiineae bacterium]
MIEVTRDDLVGSREPRSLRRLTLEAMAASEREARLEYIRGHGSSQADRWLEFAKVNLVGPVVAHALLDAFGKDSSVADECRALHDRSLNRMRVMLSELDGVAASLGREGIRMVALKNAGIARGIFPCAGCCPMGDLDVLVDRDRFRDAHALIIEQGFSLATRGTVEAADLEEGEAHGGTEYVKQTAGEEVWFELQWRPIAGRWIRRDQEPVGAHLIARSVPIDGTEVRLLAPEDNMLQVALHTAKHTYVRAPGLRLHTDVDRLTAFNPPNWANLAGMTEELDVRTAVYFSLAFARALLGTPVPKDVLTRLAPPWWKTQAIVRWLRAIDVFDPEASKFNRPEMMVFAAMLYDDAEGLLASALDSQRSELTWRNAHRFLGRGFSRMKDIVTRYQA